ncbi:MAG: hypothetical protein WCK53_16150, partial [Methanomicrobiales archaeon]
QIFDDNLFHHPNVSSRYILASDLISGYWRKIERYACIRKRYRRILYTSTVDREYGVGTSSLARFNQNGSSEFIGVGPVNPSL